jgi:hypothetical protein
MCAPKLILSAAALLTSIYAIGCQKPVKAPETEDTRTRLGSPLTKGQQEPPTVMFDLSPSASRADSPNAKMYDCTYGARGKTAKFQIQLVLGAPLKMDAKSAEFTEGKFISVSGSENATLLEDLKVALEAKRTPTNLKRKATLPFDLVVLGEKQSRDSEGGYSSKPAGDWTAAKMFLPSGGDDGEVYLNLNFVLGKGEFSIKDSDYGDYLLQEFAKVL